GSRKTDSPEVVRRRLAKARDEIRVIRDYADYDYVIVNDDFEQALGELEAIVTARRKSSGRVDRDWVESNFLRQEDF
ncbi:MAG: hypothetical protein PVG55_05870, partial [Nitrospirota bacterium]